MDAEHCQDARGFTLVETIVALGLMAALATGTAQLLAVSLDAGRAARDAALMTALAAGKIEQLRTLDWIVEVPPGLPPVLRTDRVTSLGSDPPSPAGSGLSESPPEALDRDTAGYVDYLDAGGRWVGTAPVVPPSAVYVRRWAVRHLPADPDRALALQVVVTTLAAERRRPAAQPRAWTGQDVVLTTIVARRAR